MFHIMNVLVTGATRGIGRCIVDALARRPIGVQTIFLCCRDMEQGRQLAADLDQSHGSVEPLQLDVTVPATISAAAAKLEADGVTLDALINNAGVLLERDGIDLASIVEPTLRVNFDGVMMVTEAFTPLMRDGGLILNVSSGAGTRAAGKLNATVREELEQAADGLRLRQIIARVAREVAALPHPPGETPIYSLSKAAVNFYTVLVARSMMRVRAHACSPGFCRTEIAGSDADYSKRAPKSPDLGADVAIKLVTGHLGAGDTGRFYKECSKPGTPLGDARSQEESWVAL